MTLDQIAADERRGVVAALAAFDRTFADAGPGADEWATTRSAVVAARAAQRVHGWKSEADVSSERARLNAVYGRQSVAEIAESLMSESRAASGAAHGGR